MERRTEKDYDLPRDFYNFAKPYLEDEVKITKQEDLVHLWQVALDSTQYNPSQREVIAEWTMSIGSYTPFIHDNDIFQAIHDGFGSLEVADSDPSITKRGADQEWEKQRKLFSTLLQEIAEKPP